MSTLWTRRILALVVIMGICSAATTFAAKTKPKKEAPPPEVSETEAPAFPPAELTVGFQARDSETEGIGDLLVPVWNPGGAGLLFLNPRTAITDHDGEEANIGVGYRQLLPKWNVILGANAFYDYRDTGAYNYHQWGFGLELLSQWLDARFNYYDPEDKTYVAATTTETSTRQSVRATTRWEDPYATGHEVRQNLLTIRQLTTTTTTRTFELFEQPYGGHDWEIGLRLPINCNGFEARLFGGYYDFDRDCGAAARGWKTRAEIRLRSSLFLDAGLYENDKLTGSDWYLGARLTTPLDLAQLASGRNPFATAKARWSGEPADLASRLTEMVMRDPQIRLEHSKFIENPQLRTETATTKKTATRKRHVLLPDVQFVNGDAPAGGDGTGERPFNQIQQGADSVFGDRNVYVYNASGPYMENVVLQAGTTLCGSGVQIPGYGGKTFGSGIAPVVDGNNLGPSITVANQTTVKGFSIRNTDRGLPPIIFDTPAFYNVNPARMGIFGNGATDVTITRNLLANNETAAHFSRIGSFRLNFSDNTVEDNSLVGLEICTAGAGLPSSDTCEATVARNSIQNNGSIGLYSTMWNYQSSLLDIADSDISRNTVGVSSSQAESGDAILIVRNLHADHNAIDGLLAEQILNINNLIAVAGSSFDHNTGYGVNSDQRAEENSLAFFGMPEGLDQLVNAVGAFGGPVPAFLAPLLASAGGVSASHNGRGGIDCGIYAQNDAALGAFFDVTANGNEFSGLVAEIVSDGNLAVGLAGGSGTLNNLLNLGSDAVAGMLGIDLPVLALGNGEMQVNDNSSFGMLMAVRGDTALAAVAGVTANGNEREGISLHVQGLDDATATIVDSHANHNLGHGFDLAAVSADGDAYAGVLSSEAIFDMLASMDLLPPNPTYVPAGPCTASDNGRLGLNLLSSNNTGEASAMVDGITVERNGTGGIRMNLISSAGNVFAELADARMRNNVGIGARLDLNANQNAIAVISDTLSTGNQDRGYQLKMNSDEGEAHALLGGVTASHNTRAGIWAELSATDVDGVAVVAMTAVNSISNTARGAHFDITGGDSAHLLIGSDALASYEDHFSSFNFLDWFGDMIPQGPSVFSDNGAGGLQATLTGGEFAWLDLRDVTANNNANNGMNMTLTASSISAEVSNVTARSNSHGLRLEFAGTPANPGERLITTIQRSQFSDNSLNGITVESGYNGPHDYRVRHNVSANNTGNGLRLNFTGAGPYNIDCGGSPLFHGVGQNSFYGNGNRDLRVNNGINVSAQNNWWGQVPPVAGQFAGDGVDWSNWLLTDPNAP